MARRPKPTPNRRLPENHRALDCPPRLAAPAAWRCCSPRAAPSSVSTALWASITLKAAGAARCFVDRGRLKANPALQRAPRSGRPVRKDPRVRSAVVVFFPQQSEESMIYNAQNLANLMPQENAQPGGFRVVSMRAEKGAEPCGPEFQIPQPHCCSELPVS